MRNLTINNRDYRWPDPSVTVICLDGTNTAYLEAAASSGTAPFLARMLERGTYQKVHSVIPSVTNPNNISIMTGVPPSVHGIPGNYFWNKEVGSEVLMNSPEYLRVESIPAKFSQMGARAAAVTAKDKLRQLLGHRLQGICFSAEKANETTVAENGISDALDFVGQKLPSIYSEEVSVFVLQAGVRLMECFRPDLMYLSTTDYIQHKYAPGTAQANKLFAAFDPLLQRLDALGATLVLTADHGMNPKVEADGKPRCLYLRPFFEHILGPGSARIILPITDPYVVHHGSLGSFAGVHLADPFAGDAACVNDLLQRLSRLPGIECAYNKREACVRYDLPADRTGDIVVLAKGDTVLGLDEASHDLSLLDRPLRSHGGIAESIVPLVSNKKITFPDFCCHNYDAFFLGINCAEQ